MKALLPFVFSLPILLTACGGDNSASNGVDQVDKTPGVEHEVGKNLRMNLNLDKLQSAGVVADRIVVTITKGEFTKTIEVEHADYSAMAEFSNLVVGEYQITVQIFDGDTLVAEGEGTGTVSASQLATVDLRLELMSGGLAVNVCVPDEVSEYEVKIDETFSVTQVFEPTGALIRGELIAGAPADYHNTLPHINLGMDGEIHIEARVENIWQDKSEGIKSSMSDNNTLIVSFAGEEVFFKAGCNDEVVLQRSTLDPFERPEGERERLGLVFNIDVDGMDYLTDGSGGFVLGDTMTNDMIPVYRKITQLTVRVQFEPLPLEFLETRTGMMDLGFSNADLTELFDSSKFTHSIEIEQAGYEGELGMVQLGAIVMDGLWLVPVLAESL
jgi:hypothetical protein